MEVSNGTGQNTDYRVSGTGGSGQPEGGNAGGFHRCKDYAKGELTPYTAEKCVECFEGSFYVEFVVDNTKIVRWFASNPGRVDLVEVDKGVYAIRTT